MTEITSRQKGWQREREGSRLPAEQRAWCGALSQDSGILTWAKDRGILKCVSSGAWVAQWVGPLPSAQVMISGSWDRVPHRALSAQQGASFPSSLSACLSVYLWSLSNKFLKKPPTCCLQETNFKPEDTARFKVRGWKRIYHANGHQKAGVAILISDQLDLSQRLQ